MLRSLLYASAWSLVCNSSFALSMPKAPSVLISCSVSNQFGASVEEGGEAESSTNLEQNNAVSGRSEIYEYSGYKKDLPKNLFEISILDKRSGKSARAESEIGKGQRLVIHLDGLAEPITTLTLKCEGA